ncbi:MAG: hypothetical protein ACK5MR_18085 [Cumulibacter sp.]
MRVPGDRHRTALPVDDVGAGAYRQPDRARAAAGAQAARVQPSQQMCANVTA